MRFTPCLVLLLVGLIGVRPAAAAAFDRLYVFGDRSSDFGAGSVDGDGPTAVAYLAWQMGLTFTQANAPCAGRTLFDQDSKPVADPDTYFFCHQGHPSTAVHRRVGQKLAVEVAAHEPGAGP
jgi:phospholipase/lecithinase/hemolysin